MGKYKLFYGENFYPSGGYEDFKGYFESIEQCQKEVKDKFEDECMWAHIVLEDKIIMRGKCDVFPKREWEWDEDKMKEMDVSWMPLPQPPKK